MPHILYTIHMSEKKKLISIIVPVYNEEANLEWHHERIVNYLLSLKQAFEIIYVNDGSRDGSIDILRKLASKDSTTHYISFSRNFGKEAATTAGLAAARGDAAIMLDADGQHPIEMVDIFIKEWQKGYATVIGVRNNNGHTNFFKTLGSRLFYAILRLLHPDESGQHGLTDFRLVDRKIIDEYNKLTEHNRITRNLLDWLGYSRKLIPFETKERHAGTAAYSYRKLIKLAIDGIVKHSTKPLKFIGAVGLLISLLSATAGLFVLIEQYALSDPLKIHISGTALLALFLSFMVGVVLVCQGLLALYIENVYYESQGRPLYVIEEEG